MTSFCHGEIRMQWVIPPLEVFKGAQDSPSMRAEIWDGFIQNKINKEYPCIEVGFKSKPIFPNFFDLKPSHTFKSRTHGQAWTLINSEISVLLWVVPDLRQSGFTFTCHRSSSFFSKNANYQMSRVELLGQLSRTNFNKKTWDVRGLKNEELHYTWNKKIKLYQSKIQVANLSQMHLRNC